MGIVLICRTLLLEKKNPLSATTNIVFSSDNVAHYRLVGTNLLVLHGEDICLWSRRHSLMVAYHILVWHISVTITSTSSV